jgi:hypothetical protein
MRGICKSVLAVGIALTGHALAQPAELPPDSAYVQTTPEGNLTLNGQPVRYWGLVCAVAGGSGAAAGDSDEVRQQKVAANRAKIDLFTQRLTDMGFNLVRTWEGRYPAQQKELPLLNNHDYEVGDGSDADAIAYSWAQMDKAGIKIWMSSTNGIGDMTPEDVGIIEDPATAEQWKQAVADFAKVLKRETPAVPIKGQGTLLATFDERTEALWIARLKQLADFPNKYKGGLRLGDDPQIVVWELTNEEFPFRHFFNGDWQKLPPYFRNKLLARWNDFLKTKYGSEEKLKQAWGYLLPEESLDRGTIMLAPLSKPVKGQLAINDTNPAVIASLTSRKEDGYSRDDFNYQRGADVIEFASQLIISHKQRMEKALEAMGKGCRLSPTVYDSGNDFRIQAAWMHQHADAVSTCSYTKGMGYDPRDERFPFYSHLDDAPRTSWGVPWFEQSAMLNKAHFVYETNIGNQTKYRAEYPFQVSALASIQDWDIVVWHTYPGRDKTLGNADKPFEQQNNMGGDYFTIRGDEVFIAALRAAGDIYRQNLIAPAPDPVVFTFGRRTLLDPVSMDYGRSYGELGERLIDTTYRFGSRVVIDPTKEEDSTGGRHTIRPNIYVSNPIEPNDQISFNTRRGHLMMDSPAAASYTGFFGEYGKDTITFDNSDVSFGNITFNNPEGIAYPVKPEEGYCTISLVSQDGQPLAQSKRTLLVATSTSFNPGYQLDTTRSSKGRQQDGAADTPPQEHRGSYVVSGGKGDALVVRVGVTVKTPAIDGMAYTFRDFQGKAIAQGTVQNGTLVIPDDQPVWLVELQRP